MHPREIFLTGSTLAVPIFSWTIVSFLERMTGWLYHSSWTELVGILAYGMVNALIETALAAMFVSAVVVTIFHGRFRSHRFTIALISSLVAVAVAAAFQLLADRLVESPRMPLTFAAVGLVVFAAGCVLVIKSPRVARALAAFADRSKTLTCGLYLPLSAVGLLVLIARNWS